jgi:hypothetical protein
VSDVAPSHSRLIDRTGDLVNSAKEPLTEIADVFLWEVENMLDYAIERNNPRELAELRRLIGGFSNACARLVAPERVYRRPDCH